MALLLLCTNIKSRHPTAYQEEVKADFIGIGRVITELAGVAIVPVVCRREACQLGGTHNLIGLSDPMISKTIVVPPIPAVMGGSMAASTMG